MKPSDGIVGWEAVCEAFEFVAMPSCGHPLSKRTNNIIPLEVKNKYMKKSD